MSAQSDLRDAVAAKLAEKLPLVNVLPYRGSFEPEAIMQVARTLPCCAVSIGGVSQVKRMGGDVTMMVDVGVAVVTKPGATDATRLAGVGDSAAAIGEAVVYQAAVHAWQSGASDWEQPQGIEAVNRSAQPTAVKLGIGFYAVGWSQVVTIPSEISAQDLDDLVTIHVDTDLADRGPDGSTPPDGVVDFSTTITGLDQ